MSNIFPAWADTSGPSLAEPGSAREQRLLKFSCNIQQEKRLPSGSKKQPPCQPFPSLRCPVSTDTEDCH